MYQLIRKFTFTIAALTALVAPPAIGQEAEVETESSPAGLSLSAELSTIYNFRGFNTFMEDSMSDQNGLFAPGLTWSIFDSGLSIGYWGAYQISGDNTAEMVDVALGCEQNLFIGYDLDLIADTLALSAAFTYFFYPFADEDAAGAKNPSFIEPLVALGFSGPLDLGLGVSYFAGIQEEVELYRYLYINPSIAKSVELGGRYSAAAGLSFGYKLFNDRDEMKDNVVDVRFDLTFPTQLADALYIEPAVHLSWTNIDEKTITVVDAAGIEQPTVVDGTVGDGFMAYLSLAVGADF